MDPCQRNDNDLNGLSFVASYIPQPNEQFFARLLRFTETTQQCGFETFIPIDSDYTLHGVSLHTECPLLALGELIFPEMSHTMNFIGSMPDCFPHDSLGVANAALVIESKLKNNRLPLGNVLELQPSSGPADVTTVFGRSSDADFVSQLHSVNVTLFSEVFQTSGTIQNNQLTMLGISRVFGYPAELHITAPSNETNWDDLLFTVQGDLQHGEGSFIQCLSDVVKRKLTQLANSGNARLKVAQMSLNQSLERVNEITAQFDEAVSNVEQAEEQNIAANDTIAMAEARFRVVQQLFDNSQSELENLTLPCTEEPCESVCMPGESCRSCSRPTFITKTSRCPITVKETRNIRVAPFFVKRTTWRWVTECRLENNQICQRDECPVGETRYCYGKCVPVVESLLPVYNWRMVEVDVQTYENCTVTLFNSTVPDTCCDEVSCAVFAPSTSCVMKNAMYRSAREIATEELEGMNKELFQMLQEAQKNLSLARTAASKAEVTRQIHEQRREQLQTSLERVVMAHDKAKEVYNKTLEEIEPLLRVSQSINGDDFQNLFDITSVTFNTKISKQSPTALELNVLFGSDADGFFVIYDESYIYFASQGKENFERIADDIINDVFIGSSKRSLTQIRRQVTGENALREIFASRCAHISNTKLFFMEIRTKLEEVQTSIETSQEGANRLSQNLTDQGLPEDDDEVDAYIDLIKTFENKSVEAVRVLEDTIFSEWQASMEFLYSESGSVGEVSCDGFADCLQTSVDELQSLVDLTPEVELSEEFVSLLSSLPMAVNSLLELALSSNISINQALDRIRPIITITDAYATDNYWCNEPPVMTIQPPPEVNISLGDTLTLSCEAESDLAVTYEWKKDGNVMPQFKSSVLVIENIQRLDSANYTCFANNPVGSAESVTTSVTVYELPEFYLLPQSVATYYGDDNGAWFACNASAWPFPGWRWFYRSSDDEEWTIIEGEETNELLISNPQEENVGMYACEAYNYHGSIRSEAVTLTLLPLTVSRHQFVLEFSIFVNASSAEGQFCSDDDLYDSIYGLIYDAIGDQVSIMKDLNVTQLDLENFDISLTLLSENVTTRYLHLMTFAEIANLALPQATSIRRSVQSITVALNEESVSHDCEGAEFSVVEGSLVVGQLTYVCPPGQRLNSDYLLCCKFITLQ